MNPMPPMNPKPPMNRVGWQTVAVTDPVEEG